jgi:lipoyl synthase
MDWLSELKCQEAFEDIDFDNELIAKFQIENNVSRPIRFSSPTFKEYESDELSGCSKNTFPAFSITGAGCALNCDHCQKKILEPMIPTIKPQLLDNKVRDLIMLQNLQGFLLSGGSDKNNEINYERFYPVIEGLKRDFPYLKIAIHTALLDYAGAKRMESAGVDTAMTDIIGAQETINQVYHLNRPVADFEETLSSLTATKMDIVPHIVIGLHYGKILGEENALEIVAKYPVNSLVLVVIMPFYAKENTFQTPDPKDIGEFFLKARKKMGDRKVLLGCARPPGKHKIITDAYAIMAGLDGIAYPADGAVSVAKMINRPFEQAHSCCSIKLGDAKPFQKVCAA